MVYKKKSDKWELKLCFPIRSELIEVFGEFYQKILQGYSNFEIYYLSKEKQYEIYINSELAISFSHPYIVYHGRRIPEKRIKICCYKKNYIFFIQHCFRAFKYYILDKERD